jgi:hypothetical protein
MGGANLPQQQQIPANLTEEQDARRIEKQGMSDQGIVSLGEGVNAAKGLYKDVKKAMIDPAISAGKEAVTKLIGSPDEMVAEKMYPMMQIETLEEYYPSAGDEMIAEMKPKMSSIDKKMEYATLDPRYATKIKGMISPSGIQQNTSVDKVRYDRNATGSEFKGVKAKSKPAKSVINMTADEAMQDL